jgi:hypothetical protein
MQLARDEEGVWTAKVPEDEKERSSPELVEAMPRYLTILDALFHRAQSANELEFLFSLFRVRGFQDPGWDPYETTLQSIPPLVACAETTRDALASQHLRLWIYGHIVEASEPYELIANLVEVARGKHYAWNTNFLTGGNSTPSPGKKIEHIVRIAAEAGIEQIGVPLKEVWFRELRNAVFHADYILYGGGVRLANPPKEFSESDILRIVNRAIAYHSALALIFRCYVSDYNEPVTIPNSPHFSGDPQLEWRVVVRDRCGAVGVKHNWTPEQVREGKIPVHVGRFFEDEAELLRQNPFLDRFPARPDEITLP